MKIYETENLILKTLDIEDVTILKNYFEENREFFKEWEPVRDKEFYEQENIVKIIESLKEDYINKRAVPLHIFLKSSNKLIGYIALSNIVRGAFLSCFLGYKLHKDYIKRGYMSEALEKMKEIAFEEYKLHRVEANIIPRNKASRRLVEKAGFEEEGLSKKYLKINGVWEDHCHYVILNEKVE